jgi:hypothetical protein
LEIFYLLSVCSKRIKYFQIFLVCDRLALR